MEGIGAGRLVLVYEELGSGSLSASKSVAACASLESHPLVVHGCGGSVAVPLAPLDRTRDGGNLTIWTAVGKTEYRLVGVPS